MAATAILVFEKIKNFNDMHPVWGQSAPACQISSKSIKRLLRYGDLTVFSKWRQSAILDLSGAYWATREDYLVVFIVEQNLVGIAAVLSII